MDHLEVFCADVGSVKKGKFGWASCQWAGDRAFAECGGSDIDRLIEAIVRSLNQEPKVALGFECPLFAPIHDNCNDLTSKRKGEGDRPWSAGAGVASMGIGLVEATWLLSKTKESSRRSVEPFVDWEDFRAADSGLFLWEAFVSGKSKGSNHVEDAKRAVKAFTDSLPNPQLKNAVSDETKVISLIGASLLRSGWTTSINILSRPCIVIKA